MDIKPSNQKQEKCKNLRYEVATNGLEGIEV